jgi:hypothetical protein
MAASYAVWRVEVVPSSAIRKGDRILLIGRRRDRGFVLEVVSQQRDLGRFAKECDVAWPGGLARGFSLGERGAKHLRLARQQREGETT